MKFEHVIGQEQIKKECITAIKQDAIPQAMLFLGHEGTGKLPMALAVSQFINCENQLEQDSCGTCSSCQKSSKYIHPDIHYTYPTTGTKSLSKDYIKSWREMLSEKVYPTIFEWIAYIDNENKQGNISAEECNQIIRQLSLKQFEGKYKIQIIWMAEYLGKNANKLLKIIEEPPRNTVFILIAQSEKEILPTVLSRTQIFKFRKLTDASIEQALINLHHIDTDRSKKISLLAEGNWIAATQFLHESHHAETDFLSEWLHILQAKAENPNLQIIQQLNEWVDRMAQTGRQHQKAFLTYVLFFLRECMLINMPIPKKLSDEELSLVHTFLDDIDIQIIEEMSNLINKLHYYTVRNANARIAFMDTSIKLSALLKKKMLLYNMDTRY